MPDTTNDDGHRTEPLVPAWTHRVHWLSQTAGHALMRPDATALRFNGVDESWAELHERSLRLAAALRERGVGAGDRVLLLTLNRPEFVEAVFAINSLSAIAVPVNFRLAPPEVSYIVEDTGATTILLEKALAPLVLAVAESTDALRTRIVIGSATGPAAGMEPYES